MSVDVSLRLCVKPHEKIGSDLSKLEAVQAQVEAGAKVDSSDEDGATPLIQIARSGHVAVLQRSSWCFKKCKTMSI